MINRVNGECPLVSIKELDFQREGVVMVKTVVTEWVELSQAYLFDGPPRRKRHEGYLFVNRCEVRQLKSGLMLLRTHGVDEIQAESKAELERKVADYANQPDVRLLRKGLETNDFHVLPSQSRKVTPELLNGTADIYERNEDEEVSENLESRRRYGGFS
ncbi:MAG TPA: hypothetical protein VIX17_11625 [Pyrinomonadaceae bacterium]